MKNIFETTKRQIERNQPKSYTIEATRTAEGLFLNKQLCTIKKGGKVCVIENNSTGTGHSAHANICASGSLEGMKKLGYWGKDDKTHKQGGFIYNLSTVVISGELDALALFIERGGEYTPPTEIDQWTTKKFTFSI